jgi:hypothetical protein
MPRHTESIHICQFLANPEHFRYRRRDGKSRHIMVQIFLKVELGRATGLLAENVIDIPKGLLEH